jgi:hypothetical protein
MTKEGEDLKMDENTRNALAIILLIPLMILACLGGGYLFYKEVKYESCPEINIVTNELNKLGDGAIYGNVTPKDGRMIEAIGPPQNTGPGIVTLEKTQMREKVGFTIRSTGNLFGKITIPVRDSEGCLVKKTIPCGLQKGINIGIYVVIIAAWVLCAFICWRIYEVWKRKGEEL